MFCQSCGREIAEPATVCPNCGAPVRGIAPPGASSWKPVEHVSGAWYLLPLSFGILGGIIAWAVNRDKDPGRARNLLIFGVLWTLIPTVLIASAVYLYYAPCPRARTMNRKDNRAGFANRGFESYPVLH